MSGHGKATVSKRKWTYKGRENSAWVVRYRDDKGARKSTSFPLKKNADAYADRVNAALAAGTHIAPSDASTVAQMCEAFLRHQETRRDDGRIGRTHHDQTKIAVDRSIIRHLGTRKVTDLTPPMIEEWYRTMVKVDGVAPTTARVRVYLLRWIEDFANKRGIMKTRPVREAATELKGIKAKPIRQLGMDQVAKLLEIVSGRALWGEERQWRLMACYVHLAAFCGLRFGEIGGLHLDGIDLDRRMLLVRHSLTEYDEVKGPKTAAGVRDVPMPPHVVLMVRKWVGDFYVPNDRSLIFRIQRNAMVSAPNFHQRSWRPLLRHAGFEGPDWPHVHSLRHFCASMMATRMPLPDVAAMLGHSSFDMTLQVYAHPILSGARRHEAVDSIASELVPLASAPALVDQKLPQAVLSV